MKKTRQPKSKSKSNQTPSVADAARLEDAMFLDAEIRSLVHHHDESLVPLRAEVDHANARLSEVLVLVDALEKNGSPFTRHDDLNELARLFQGGVRIVQTILELHAVDVDDEAWHGMKEAIARIASSVDYNDENRRFVAPRG